MDGTPANLGRRAPQSAVDRSQHFASKQRCSVCNDLLTVHEVAQRGVCSRPACRRQLALRDFTIREFENYEKRRDRARQSIPAVHPHSTEDASRNRLVVVPVPVMSERAIRLPSARRHAFLRRLIGALRELWDEAAPTELIASESSSDPPGAAAPVARFTAAACATCRGSCCQVGADHAFIGVSTLRAQRSREPALTPATLFRRYKERIPLHGYRDSCLFHTRTGCALPRSLRSSICNQHLCRDLLRAFSSTPDLVTRPIWLAAIRDNAARPMRTRFHDPGDR